jgi:hypothetical protein
LLHLPPPPDMENGHAKYRVAVIGSGNWGSVASRLIASNTAKLPTFQGRALFQHRMHYYLRLIYCTVCTDYLQMEPPLVLDLTSSTHTSLCLCAPI